jgi:hypothetical protein
MSGQPGAELLLRALDVWGSPTATAHEAAVILTVVVGDIARIARDGTKGLDDEDAHRMARELGNLMLTAPRLAAAFGLDPDACITAAVAAQRAWVAKRGTR